jgi:acetolactate synthase-1/2/3 large subunit
MQRVAAEGVRHVFMLPGGGAMHLNDALGKANDLEYVCNLHEQASAIAAEAYSRVTNGLGVAMVTSGPGGTNAITGVAGAWLDSTPCLFLSGQVKRADLKGDSGLRMLGVQEIDIVALVSPITKYAVTVTDPSTIRYHFERAIHEARTGRRGPVWLDIPLDVQAMDVDPDSLRGFDPQPVPAPQWPALQYQVATMIKKLRAAKRPVLLVGNGVRMAGAAAEFLSFAELLGIPVLTTWLGLDLIGDDHPLFVGRPGAIAPRGANFALQNSDLLIVIGARLDMALTAYAHDRLAREAVKVIVDIDGAEIAKMRTAIELPIIADAGTFMREVRRQLCGELVGDFTPWINRCQEWKVKYPLVLEEHRSRAGVPSLYHFSDVLAQELDTSDIIATGSSGFAVEIFLLVLRVKYGQRVFHNRGTGAMGFGLPASVGAAVAGSGRRTICVDGDGGFQMNVQELATVVTNRLPIKFFVVNNDGYASIRTSQSNYFGRLVGADSTSGVRLPSLERIAEAYEVPFMRIDDGAKMRDQIRAALDRQGPILVEVVTPRDEPRGPRISSTQRPDGSMVSRPLEDLWPFLDREEFLSNMIVAPVPE